MVSFLRRQRRPDGPVGPVCPYCEQPSRLLQFNMPGYPYARQYGPIWTCVPCAAWVGCHRGSTTALGRLADANLRKAKQHAHAAFDPIWRDHREMSRHEAYAWLSKQLNLPPERTHIGEMDVEGCFAVMRACAARRVTALQGSP